MQLIREPVVVVAIVVVVLVVVESEVVVEEVVGVTVTFVDSVVEVLDVDGQTMPETYPECAVGLRYFCLQKHPVRQP